MKWKKKCNEILCKFKISDELEERFFQVGRSCYLAQHIMRWFENWYKKNVRLHVKVNSVCELCVCVTRINEKKQWEQRDLWLKKTINNVKITYRNGKSKKWFFDANSSEWILPTILKVSKPSTTFLMFRYILETIMSLLGLYFLCH